MEYNGYEELANAIILQAVKDYRHRGTMISSNKIYNKFTKFFVGM